MPTPPSPLPPLPQRGDSPEPVGKKRKGMLGFYVLTGVALALFGSFYFAWTPLKVRYWERELTRFFESTAGGRSGYAITQNSGVPTTVSCGTRNTRALSKLLEIGPPARSALERTCASFPSQRSLIIGYLGCPQGMWTFPLVIEAACEQDSLVAVSAVDAAERLSGQSFFPKGPRMVRSKPGPGAMSREIGDSELAAARKNLLDWWEREGKAKYGSSTE